MKKLVLTLGIALSAIVFVQAQESTTNVDQRAATMVNQMVSTAHLTNDEANKITPFVKAFFQTKLDNQNKYANDPAGMKQANQTNRAQLKKNLETVLNAEKMQELTTFYANKQATPSTYAPKGNK